MFGTARRSSGMRLHLVLRYRCCHAGELNRGSDQLMEMAARFSGLLDCAWCGGKMVGVVVAGWAHHLPAWDQKFGRRYGRSE